MRTTLWLMACCALAIGACSDNENQGDVFFVNTANNSVVIVSAETNTDSLVFFAVEPLDAVLVPGTSDRAVVAASTVAGSAAAVFGTCGTAVAAGAMVTLTLNDCTGPLGLQHASGTVNYTFVDLGDGNGLRVTITSDRLTVGNTTQTVNEVATVNSSNGTRTAMIHSMNTITGSNGAAIATTGDSTLTWMRGANCATVNGTFTSQASDGTATTTTAENVVRCAGACPTGRITTVATDQRGVTVTLAGSTNASFTGTSGTSGTVALVCP